MKCEKSPKQTFKYRCYCAKNIDSEMKEKIKFNQLIQSIRRAIAAFLVDLILG